MNGAPAVQANGPRLPKQVVKAARRAEQLQRQQQARLDGSDTSPQDTPSAAAATVDPKAASAPDPSSTPAGQQASADPNPTPNGAADPGNLTGPGGDASPPQLDAAAKHWQNRYHSVVGVLRAERQQSADREAQLHSTIASLRTELAQAKATTPSTVDVKLEDHFTAEQIDALGEDRAAAIVRAAHTAALESAQRQVEAALAPIRQREEQEQERRKRDLERQQEDSRQQFLDDLTAAVPNWAAINATPEWLTWLSEFDDNAMKVRDQIIQEAASRNDAQPVIALLRKYLGGQPPRPTPSVQPSTRDVGNNAPPAPSAQQRPEVLTPAEIKRRYTKLATDRSLTDEQRDAKRAELDALVKQMTQSKG